MSLNTVFSEKTFSNEMFSSLKVFKKKKKKKIGLLVTKFFVTGTFSEGATATKRISSLNVLSDKKFDF